MGQSLTNTQLSQIAQKNFNEPSCIAKIYGTIQLRPCFKFPKILTIREQYHTEMANT